MTYQTSSEEFRAASAVRAVLGGLPSKALTKLATVFRSIGTALINASEASSRIRKIEALQAKSDAELAQMGLKRDQIVHHVFKDFYYC